MYLEHLVDFERLGVPKDAGTNSAHGFDLTRMRILLEELGSPELSLRFVNVVGTKGKGSVATMLANILQYGGKLCGSIDRSIDPVLFSLRSVYANHNLLIYIF